MADSPDWLSGLMSMIPSVGSWVAAANPSLMAVTPLAKKAGLLPESAPNVAAGATVDAWRGGVEAMGKGFEFLADNDPSKMVTGPFLFGAHKAGLGESGDEWDRGAIGMLGAGFSKIGMFATFGALATTQDSWTDPGTLFDPDLRKKAWDIAFDPSQGVDFGMAMMAEKSTLEDPDGLKKLQGEMDSTWWGNFVAGTMSVAMYAATDPTKGVAKGVKAGRASKFVSDPLQAEEFAQVLNGTKKYYHGTTDTFKGNIEKNGLGPNAKKGSVHLTDNLERARAYADDAVGTFGGKASVYEVDGNGLPLSQGERGTSDFLGPRISPDRLKPVADDAVTEGFTPTKGGGIKNKTRAFAGKKQDPEYVVSRQVAAWEKLDNVTDPNVVANYLDPMWGAGSDAVRIAMPKLSEFVADLGKLPDVELQRQARANVVYAMTGSQTAREWLASNAPMVAGKIRRTTSAPQGFANLDNAMRDFAKAGDDIETFDLTPHLNPMFGDPVGRAEMAAYGDMVKSSSGFKTLLDDADAQGATLGVQRTGGKLGVQASPRMLEKLKTGINQHVMDSHFLQGGPSGRTMRVVSSLTQPGVYGYIHVKDGLLGNKQLMATLKDYESNVGASKVTPEYVTNVSERFLKANQLQRNEIITQVNRDLLAGAAEKYGPESTASRGVPLTPENVKQMTRTMEAGFKQGRSFADQRAKAAEMSGDDMAWLTDLSGSDTILQRAHLQSQLDDTVPLLDWQTANEAVDAVWKEHRLGKSLAETGGRLGDGLASGLTTYHRWWKYAQLGRPGLIFRALLDTGTRASMNIGAGNYLMYGLTGAKHYAWDRGVRGRDRGPTRSTPPVSGPLGNIPAGRRAMLPALDYSDNSVLAMNAINAATAMDSLKVLEKQGKQLDSQGKISASQAQAIQLEQGRIEGVLSQQGVANYHIDPKTHKMVSGGEVPEQYRAMSDYYAQKAEVADRITRELMGDTYKPSGLPLGVEAVIKARQPVSHAEGALAGAAERYGEPLVRTPSNATTQKGHGRGSFREDWSLISADAQLQALKADLVGGVNGNGMGARLLSEHSNFVGRENRALGKNYKIDPYTVSDNVAPDDMLWPQKYAATAKWFRDSPTAQRILQEKDALIPDSPAVILESFLSDPKFQAEYRAIKGPGTRQEKVEWLNALSLSVKSFTQNEASTNLLRSGRDITPKLVEKAMPKVGDRFPTFGPDVVLDETHHLIDNWFHFALDMPDQTFARVPMANGLYHANVKELLPKYIERGQKEGRTALTAKEYAEIHRFAKSGALNDVRRDMYDVHRMVGAHGVMSMIAPFYAPWQDAMQSWGRILYDNPEKFGQLYRFSQVPSIYGITVDRENNPIKPFDGTPMNEKFINIPAFGIGGLDKYQANIGSFNTIAQGNVPMSPGVGPLLQVGAMALVGQALPKMGEPGRQMWEFIAKHPDSLVNQTFFQSGEVPKAGLANMVASQLPSSWKKASDVIFGENDWSIGNIYPQAYGTRYADLIVQYRNDNNGKNPDAKTIERLQNDAHRGAQAAAFAGAVMSFGLGISGNAKVEGQFYVDKMHTLNALAPELKKQGLVPADVFAVMYPSAANLNWKFSENEGKLEATVSATTAFYEHRKLMEKNPDAAWWIAGADNILATLPQGERDPSNPNTFSQSAYNQQMTQGLRRRYGKEELDKQMEIAMGQGAADQFNTAMAVYLRQNNIPTINSKAAGNLSQLKSETMAAIAKDYPVWAEWSSTRNIKGREQEINQITAVAFDPNTSIAQRPDVKSTRQYLFMRQGLADAAQEIGITKWQTAKRLVADREVLWQYGNALASKDIVFQNAWSRLFEKEFADDLQRNVGAG